VISGKLFALIPVLVNCGEMELEEDLSRFPDELDS
jgi:hypothetical protein